MMEKFRMSFTRPHFSPVFSSLAALALSWGRAGRDNKGPSTWLQLGALIVIILPPRAQHVSPSRATHDGIELAHISHQTQRQFG